MSFFGSFQERLGDLSCSKSMCDTSRVRGVLGTLVSRYRTDCAESGDRSCGDPVRGRREGRGGVASFHTGVQYISFLLETPASCPGVVVRETHHGMTRWVDSGQGSRSSKGLGSLTDMNLSKQNKFSFTEMYLNTRSTVYTM